MRLLVAGNTGQLARSLLQRAGIFGAQVFTIPTESITSITALQEEIKNSEADLVLNLVGISNPDFIDMSSEANKQQIIESARNLAIASKNAIIPIIHLSGHQIFDGKSDIPNSESSAPSPDNEIGRIGLRAEDAISENNPDYVILRTSWLYGPDSKSLFLKMLALASLENDLTYVARKRMGSPTSVYSLTDGIYEIAANLQSMKNNRELRGVFHIANAGIISQLRFARYILAYHLKISENHSAEVKNQNYDADANNVITQNAVLNCDKLLYSHGIALDDWRTALKIILAESLGNN
jgi:dTDP-4-dehydrorhamnose reductase